MSRFLLPLPPAPFAKNDVGIIDSASGDLEMLGRGLRKALYNFMHGVGLDAAVRAVFAAEGVDEPNAPGDVKRAVRDCLKANLPA